MQKKIIFGIIIIIIILAVVFLSQQPYSKGIGKTFVSDATNQAGVYMSKIYPTISGEVQKRGDMIKNEVTQEKNKVSENILQKVGNYFSGIGNSITHPGTPQNCQPTQTSTSP